MTSISLIFAVIIDDEPDAINLLEMYLRHFPDVEVIGTETKAKNGLKLVNELLPDLVFLDIDMPDMNGLQIAHRIHSGNFDSEVVFTTAHQHYAYDALDIEPLDFLTKPFCIDDLETVFRKFKTKVDKKKLERKLDQFIHQKDNPLKIKLPTVHGVLVIDIKDIVYLKSQGNNCNVYLSDGKVETITRNLYILVDMLNSPTFYQISRQTAINTNYLQYIDKKTQKCILLYNKTSHTEHITDSYIQSLEKLDFVQIIQDSKVLPKPKQNS
jgi:two-component system LytT family response regulator